MEEKLEYIWSKNYLASLPASIKERGFYYSVNETQKDILISGINPSFRLGALPGHGRFDLQSILLDAKYDRYWSSLKKIIYDQENNIDLRHRTAYLDLFYFRETNQKILKSQIINNEDGLRFAVDQLELTQSVIEDTIRPKLIVVKNKESAAYWGKFADKGIFWMGYNLEMIETFDSGDLYKITGLSKSKFRVSQTLTKTALQNSYIFFTQHFQYLSKSKRPTADLINHFVTTYAN